MSKKMLLALVAGYALGVWPLPLWAQEAPEDPEVVTSGDLEDLACGAALVLLQDTAALGGERARLVEGTWDVPIGQKWLRVTVSRRARVVQTADLDVWCPGE